MQRDQSRMPGRSPPPHRHAELQPIADLFGPLSQVRMRTACSGPSGSREGRLAPSGSEQQRFPTQTCRGARRGTSGDIDLQANRHPQDGADDDVVDMHPSCTALVTSSSRYAQPAALQGLSTPAAAADQPLRTLQDLGELHVKLRRGFWSH